MSVATSNLEGFRKALAERVSFTAERVLAPYERVHKVHFVPEGAKSVSIPTFAKDISMTIVTGGTAYAGSEFSNAISETEVTPNAYTMVTTIARADALGNPLWLDAVAEAAASAYGKQIQSLLNTEYATLSAVGASGSAFTATGHINDAMASIAASGFNGPYGAIVHPSQYAALRADLGVNYGSVVQSEVVGNGELNRVYGVDTFQSSEASTVYSGNQKAGFIGTADCVQLVVRQEPTIEITPVGDGVNVKVAVACWLKADTIAANAGRLLQSS